MSMDFNWTNTPSRRMDMAGQVSSYACMRIRRSLTHSLTRVRETATVDTHLATCATTGKKLIAHYPNKITCISTNQNQTVPTFVSYNYFSLDICSIHTPTEALLRVLGEINHMNAMIECLFNQQVPHPVLSSIRRSTATAQETISPIQSNRTTTTMD